MSLLKLFIAHNNKKQGNYALLMPVLRGVEIRMEISRRNSEGYADPTAYDGLSSALHEEAVQQQRISKLISVIRYIANESGFDIKSRITLQDKKTGKEYR